MTVILQFSMPYGLNVGFEYYKAEEGLDNELNLNLLIFKIILLWH